MFIGIDANHKVLTLSGHNFLIHNKCRNLGYDPTVYPKPYSVGYLVDKIIYSCRRCGGALSYAAVDKYKFIYNPKLLSNEDAHAKRLPPLEEAAYLRHDARDE